VARYAAGLAPGSYVVVSMVRGDGEVADRWFATYNSGVAQGHNYPVAEVAALFDGLELVPPGLVEARRWRPGWPDVATTAPRDGQAIAGVARVTGRPPAG
jgi:hypothetical protein